MRHWGIVITIFYALVVAYLFWPGIELLGGCSPFECFEQEEWIISLLPFVSLLICSQAILLFLSVDQSRRRLRPRQHVFVSVATVAVAVGLLTAASLYALLFGIFGDEPPLPDFESVLLWLLWIWLPVAFFWGVWGLVFNRYRKDSPDKLQRMIGWLIKGSVLELLIAVPCHVVVRYRDDCSAPFVTGFGIATGIAVMLMAFGPSVFFLYQKRMAQYARPKVPAD